MSDNNGWRTSPLYTIAESAHLAHVSPITVRRWLYGFQTKKRDYLPILGEQEKKPLVSFLEFVEILVASKFRKNHVHLNRIRNAHDFAQQEWGMKYPFASMKLEPLGGHILHRFDEEQPGTSLATLDSKLQQWTLPHFVVETLHNFVYEPDLVSRWYPISRGVPIVVDPQVNAGLPTFENRRVTIQTIYKRWKADYDISVIATDLKLKRREVEEALRHASEVLV
ncbi:MAG: DUF433 domain-containing protein [Dehalococcoidia bacterium]|nr:DUF433 domain-containing protein [Dehalococcoidia bacterium]